MSANKVRENELNSARFAAQGCNSWNTPFLELNCCFPSRRSRGAISMTGRGRHSATRHKSREELGSGQGTPGTGGHPCVAAGLGTAGKAARLPLLPRGFFQGCFLVGRFDCTGGGLLAHNFLLLSVRDLLDRLLSLGNSRVNIRETLQ